LGHAYSALCAYDLAQKNDGVFVLRIEDIDQSRARASWETQIYDDLNWLGLKWEQPVMRQSQNMDVYQAALATLWKQGLLYPCMCTRRDIQQALSAPQEGATPQNGPDGLIYPGTCRNKPKPAKLPQDAALRLDMAKALTGLGDINFTDTGVSGGQHCYSKQALIETVGDVVLARRDMGTSYHLSVVLDDAQQAISHVVRGMDLFDATAIHVVLQKLLGLPTPTYHHHALVRDSNGKRLAKRDDARAIAQYRADGLTPQNVIALSRSSV